MKESLSSSNCNLKELNLNAISRAKELSCTQITCDGVRALINGSIPTKKLKRLRLQGHSIRSSGANAIAQCLNQTGLNALDLRNNQIGERGVVAIAYVCGTRSYDKERDTSRVKILLEGNPVDSEILKLVQ